jgi:hypothetical protein
VDVIGYAPQTIQSVLADIDLRDAHSPIPQGTPMEKLIAWQTMSPENIRLLMGELSNQEIRNIRAVLRNIQP